MGAIISTIIPPQNQTLTQTSSTSNDSGYKVSIISPPDISRDKFKLDNVLSGSYKTEQKNNLIHVFGEYILLFLFIKNVDEYTSFFIDFTKSMSYVWNIFCIKKDPLFIKRIKYFKTYFCLKTLLKDNNTFETQIIKIDSLIDNGSKEFIFVTRINLLILDLR